MLDSIWQRLDQGLRTALPFVTALVCALLGVVPWPLPHLGTVAPPLALMALYYWTIHRPDLLRPGMAFVVGLLNDLVQGLPPGLSALLYVGLHQILLRQRRFFAGHAFFMMWSGFALTALAGKLLEWALVCLWGWQLAPILPVAMQTLLAVAFFPIPCWLFIRLQKAALANG